MKTNRTQLLSNKIIKMFIDENIPLSIQLDALKLAKQKIEWCKSAGAKINQNELNFNKIS